MGTWEKEGVAILHLDAVDFKLKLFKRSKTSRYIWLREQCNRYAVDSSTASFIKQVLLDTGTRYSGNTATHIIERQIN